ncbi:ATP-NAD kinase-like domain-containing protein [Tribonema minus]|uniref:ATP-NAD kinase-like domain-containing protein n=1 Tax=Tribonema minus TaxID=303371 RepID=A0A835ZEA1_9STRA|nr:ATP-NAD kinase-like domain-containing protein [Tribonema minus]
MPFLSPPTAPGRIPLPSPPGGLRRGFPAPYVNTPWGGGLVPFYGAAPQQGFYGGPYGYFAPGLATAAPTTAGGGGAAAGAAGGAAAAAPAGAAAAAPAGGGGGGGGGGAGAGSVAQALGPGPGGSGGGWAARAQDATGTFKSNGMPISVSLFSSSLEWQEEHLPSQQPSRTGRINFEDVVGAAAEGDAEAPLLRVFAYPAAKRAAAIAFATRSSATAVHPVRAKLLVFVSPVSGRGKGWSVWTKTLQPVLDQAGAAYTVIKTQRQHHARDIVAGKAGLADDDVRGNAREALVSANGGGNVPASGDVDVAAYDTVAVIGGDGMLFEVLQGLQRRSDCAAQLRRLNLAVVPSGSGNGLCHTVLAASGEAVSALSASFVVARGQPRAVDVSRVTTSAGKTYLALLSQGWAMFSDLDFGLEGCRWMGASRFDVAIGGCIARFRSYRARISWLPADPLAPPTAFEPDAVPALGEPLGSAWHTVEGNFTLYLTSQVSHISGDGCVDPASQKAGVVAVSHISGDGYVDPASRLGDGTLQLMYIERQAMGRMAVLNFFLAIPEGKHLSKEGVKAVRCRAVRLEPLTNRHVGMHALDGERIEYGALQQVILPRAANVLCGPCAQQQSGDVPLASSMA